jgi:NAD(P)-dependent dehydrogenase (short-subunit alcohol dehydrogenase family)
MKVVIITGTGGGIGGALVRTYLQDEYLVIGLDKKVSKKNKSDSFVEIKTDLFTFTRDYEYRENIINKVKGFFPENIKKLIIINNAAEQILKPVLEINFEDWQKSFAVNTIAPFFLAQSFTKYLALSEGHIMNVTSIHSKLTKDQFTCYAASKAALESITRSLAIELSPKNISVNAIAPAAIATGMLKEGFSGRPEKLRELENYHPSKSIGTPIQVSRFIKSITDQEGGFLTGSVLDYNGGIGGRLHDPS